MISTLLVGFGFSAKTFHLPFLRYLEDYSVTGVVSSRPDDVAAAIPDGQVWPSLDEALSSASFELVVITTPNHLHASQARASLEAGCNVLVEKPFTLSVRDANSLIAVAEEKKRDLSVYHNRRFDGDFLTLKRLLEDERLGTVRRFESRFDRFRPTPKNRWRENAGPGSGITWDLAPHLIDQALVLFGMPESVYADIQILRNGGQSDDAFDISLTYPHMQVRLGSSPFQAGPTLRFDVQGERGSYRKYHLDPQEAQLRSGKTPEDSGWACAQSEQDGTFYNESSEQPIRTQDGDYLGFYQQLARKIQGQTMSPAPATEVVKVIQLLELVRKSSSTGTCVRVKSE